MRIIYFQRSWRLLCLALFLSLFSLGCGEGGASGTKLSGKVTYKNRKGKEITVTGGEIIFYQEKLEVTRGYLGGDGTYNIPQVKAGKYKVVINPDYLRTSPEEATEEQPNPPKYVRIPEGYKSVVSTPLEITVGSDPAQVHNIQLTD